MEGRWEGNNGGLMKLCNRKVSEGCNPLVQLSRLSKITPFYPSLTAWLHGCRSRIKLIAHSLFVTNGDFFFDLYTNRERLAPHRPLEQEDVEPVLRKTPPRTVLFVLNKPLEPSELVPRSVPPRRLLLCKVPVLRGQPLGRPGM